MGEQTWSLVEIDGELFCGHTKGTFIINGSKAKKIDGTFGSLVKVITQGSAADIIKIAMVKINNEFQNQSIFQFRSIKTVFF